MDQKEVCPRCKEFGMVSKRSKMEKTGSVVILFGVLMLVFIPIAGWIIGPVLIIGGLISALFFARRATGGTCEKCGYTEK